MVNQTEMSTPKTVDRFDAVPLRGKARLDEWGNYHVPAVFVTPGVYPYRQHDGTVQHELKPADEVYATRFIESLQSATLTDGHPPFAVTPDNAKEYDCGHVKEGLHRTDEGLSGEIVVKDKGLIAKMDSRKVTQISVGLNCIIDPTPGIWTAPDGTKHPYSRIQRTMAANHAAGVATARVPTANLRLDSAEMIVDVEPTERAEPMTTPSLMRLDVGDGATVEVEPATGHTIKSYISTLIKAGREITEDRDKQLARADAAEESIKETQEKLAKWDGVDVDVLVNERTYTLAGARKLMKSDEVDKLVTSKATNYDIRKAACLVAKPDFKLEDRNDSYIESRFDSLVDAAQSKPADKQAAEVAGILNAAPPAAEQPLVQRMDAANKKLSTAWKVKAS